MTLSSVTRKDSSLTSVLVPAMALLLAAGCSGGGVAQGEGGSAAGGSTSSGGDNGNGGTNGSGGSSATGGINGSGGSSAKGGSNGNGGTTAASSTTSHGGNTTNGGSNGTGGGTASGGVSGTGGYFSKDGGSGSGGAPGLGGSVAKGGTTGAGGTATGAGGVTSKGGTTGTGGKTGTGGSGVGGSTVDGGATPVMDCTNIPAMPTTGGTKYTGDGQNGTGNLAWQLWANTANNGSITTYPTPAFSAAWANAGDYLARLGFEWGNSPKTYDTYGTIAAQVAFTKTGDGGGYSYIGIYGWSTNPCIEWYIVDDSFKGMPVNPGNTQNKGTLSVDDGTYTLYTRSTTGTGGNRCGSNVQSWNQYYSVRQKARQCGVISITKHFDAWKAASMPLGDMLEAKILVEAGGGTGSVDFPIANMTAQ